jgi:RNA polymerase sigma factor for flagellar operon FliA
MDHRPTVPRPTAPNTAGSCPANRRCADANRPETPDGEQAASSPVDGHSSVPAQEAHRISSPARTTAGDDIFEQYRSRKDPALREQLVAANTPLVRHVAARLAAKAPRHVELAELVSHGFLGLLDALERYDPARGVAFSTYATHRIRGAILEGMRQRDWAPRTVRAQVKALEAAGGELAVVLGRTPSRAETASWLGVDEATLAEIEQHAQALNLVPLDQPVKQPDRPARGPDGEAVADTIPDAGPGPGATLEERADLERLSEAVSDLGDRERAVVLLYYRDNLPLARIGEILGVSETRASQLHVRALKRLRSRLAQLQLLDWEALRCPEDDQETVRRAAPKAQARSGGPLRTSPARSPRRPSKVRPAPALALTKRWTSLFKPASGATDNGSRGSPRIVAICDPEGGNP